MPINFAFRQLSGFYNGGVNNRQPDYLNLNNSLLEIHQDIVALYGLTASEAIAFSGTITQDNFQTGSINANVLLPGSITTDLIASGTITGGQIITNSIFGLTDANISSNANISASKINVGQISHTQISNIGTNTHPSIDSQLSQLWQDTGLTNGLIQSPSLLYLIDVNAATISQINSSLATTQAYVNRATLSTTSQTLSAAINELVTDLQSIGSSGLAISGPVSSTNNAVATWNGTTGRVLQNSNLIVDSAGNIIVSGNLLVTSGQSHNLGSFSAPISNIYVSGSQIFLGPASITSNSGLNISATNSIDISGSSLSLQNIPITFNNISSGYILGGTGSSLNMIPIGTSIPGLSLNGLNTTLGTQASTSGTANTLVGFDAGQSMNTGQDNTMVGFGAGTSNNGSNNVFMGYIAGNNNVGSGNVFIGSSAGWNEHGSNLLYITNGSSPSAPLISGNFSTSQASINGYLTVGESLSYPVQLGIFASGSSQSTATILTGAEFSEVTGTLVNGSGVVLPVSSNIIPSLRLLVANYTGIKVNVFPPSAGTINRLGQNNPYILSSGITGQFINVSGLQWYSVP